MNYFTSLFVIFCVILSETNFVYSNKGKQSSHLKELSPNIKCVPNNKIKFSCFNCKCTPDGMDVECDPIDECVPNIRYYQKQNPVKRCTPQFSTIFQCLKCTCNSNGMSVKCTTRKRCFHGESTSVVKEKEKCTPNGITRIQCIECKCDAKGMKAHCKAVRNCQFYNVDKLDTNVTTTKEMLF